MSHVVAGDILVNPKHLDCFIQAVMQTPGLKFKKDSKTFKWYGRWVNDYDATDAAYKLGINTDDYGKCDHEIEVEGCAYSIGLMKHKESGMWRVVYDFFGPGNKIRSLIGSQSEGLLKRYGVNVAKKTYSAQGYTVSEKVNDKGQLQVIATKYAAYMLVAIQTVCFADDGKWKTVYHEGMPELGRMEVSRASHVEFNGATQLWEVRLAESPDTVSFSNASRAECLRWEHDYVMARL